MNRKVKKVVLKIGISDEAKKDQPNLIGYLKNEFGKTIKNSGYLPVTTTTVKEIFDFESEEPVSYFVCRAIYVGKKKAFDKSLEKRFKKYYRNRVIKFGGRK